MAEVQRTLVTKEGLEKMKKELDELRSTKRAEIAQRLKAAIAMGDLSENSEYDEAKNAQAFLEGRILQLEQQIRTAQVIEKAAKGRVDVGSTVLIEDMEEHLQEKVTIVGSTESNPFEGRISNESPVGKAILGQKVGAVVKVTTPIGELDYKIVSVSRPGTKKKAADKAVK